VRNVAGVGIPGRDGAAAVAVLPEAALAAARLLGAVFGEVDYQRPDRAGEWPGLVPHVRAVLAARGRLPGSGERELAECAAQAVAALEWAGLPAAALDLADAAAGRGRRAARPPGLPQAIGATQLARRRGRSGGPQRRLLRVIRPSLSASVVVRTGGQTHGFAARTLPSDA
jgi:hypothetical protein